MKNLIFVSGLPKKSNFQPTVPQPTHSRPTTHIDTEMGTVCLAAWH